VHHEKLTCNAGEQLPGKILDLTVWERNKAISLEEVENALAQQIHDNANMTPIVKAVSQMYAAIPVIIVVGFESCEHAQLYS
jgi:hypothetical protein